MYLVHLQSKLQSELASQPKSWPWSKSKLQTQVESNSESKSKSQAGLPSLIRNPFCTFRHVSCASTVKVTIRVSVTVTVIVKVRVTDTDRIKFRVTIRVTVTVTDRFRVTATHTESQSFFKTPFICNDFHDFPLNFPLVSFATSSTSFINISMVFPFIFQRCPSFTNEAQAITTKHIYEHDCTTLYVETAKINDFCCSHINYRVFP